MTHASRAERARVAATLRAAATRLDAAAEDATLDGDVLAALVHALDDAIAGIAAGTPSSAGEPSTGGVAAAARPATRNRIVHDLRSTSGILLAWCHLMRRGGIGEAQLAHGREVMEQTVRRQLQLVERLVAGAQRRKGAAVSSAVTTSEPESQTGAAGGGASASASDLRGIRILIVDDDADAREAMRMMLELHGADVSTAVSAIDAFDVLQQGRPDVLISDIVMPDADGYALLRRVRAPDTGDRGLIPAIAVTGRGREADRKRALAAGYQCQLTKPIVPDELIAAVQGLVAR